MFTSNPPFAFPRPRALAALALLIAFVCAPSAFGSDDAAARARKLPSPEKIVGDYLKAVGGKKRAASVRDAVYEWSVAAPGAEAGRARTHLKAPASARADVSHGGAETSAGTNGRSAWTRDADGRLRTLTDAEARAAKLLAALDAGRLVDFKKRGVLARTVAAEQAGGEAAYVVEFATREGARLRYWFGAESKLLLKVADEARRLSIAFGDYRAAVPAVALLEPHRVEVKSEGALALVFTLGAARYNTNLADTLFDPPGGDTALNVPALLRDLTRNQDEVDRRVNEYTYTMKTTERNVNDRGQVTRERVTVHEIYPVLGYGRIEKLVSEDGVALPAERAAKEERRVAEQLEKAEREAPRRLAEWERKRAEQREKRRAERESARRRAGGAQAGAAEDEGEEDDDNLTIAAFLRACEFVSPRREQFRGRDVIVFDFRPRAGFRPSGRIESVIAKLVGVVWVDPADRQVMRMEARFADNVNAFGGLASLRSGSAFVFEQTRLPEGVWMPRFSQANVALKLFLVAGKSINRTREYSDYKRFSTRTDDAALDTPKPEKP
ncbi:MAG TPA: hypothetical protein VER08_02390 [Pyrinomonadaceae bacterium]|nr:hypothetical protein [Pyrinomonadaceae bacterium]